MVSTPSKRRINFTYDAEYWRLLAQISDYLEHDLQPDEDFIWRDSGHTLEIDGNAHFSIKEDEEWQNLAAQYEEVGDIVIGRLR